jgi:hypothetical protein
MSSRPIGFLERHETAWVARPTRFPLHSTLPISRAQCSDTMYGLLLSMTRRCRLPHATAQRSKEGNVVDGPQFDTLVKRFSTTTLSRSAALRGLAASVAAFAGATLAAEPGAASQKRKICHCLDETAASCETITVGRRSARKHLRRHPCDYRGKCNDVSGCCTADGSPCPTLSCCSGNCLGGTCQPCKSNGTSCGASSECCSKQCNVTCQP